ncbi:MAG: hypothetical protein H0T79_17980 [Deltaproteobacteria bacterium]|nr:hypothetical protein [Deltaproteobacteria bacterium]
MRIVLAGVLGLLISGCSSKKNADGLPPATEWGAGTPDPGAMVAMPGTKSANPHGPGAAGPHSGMGGEDPHAGVDMSQGMGGTAGADPHAGVDMGSANHPPVVMPEKTAPKTLEKLPDGRVALGPFSIMVPTEWTEQPISSSMRAAHFKLAAPAGKEAELIVFYFGDTGAGGIEDNIDRWLSQFVQPDGKATRDVAKIEKTKVAGQDATVVSASGRFVAQAMPGATDAVDKQDQSLLAAIVASPSGPYYFKLVGAKSTVDVHGARFRALLGSMKVR